MGETVQSLVAQAGGAGGLMGMIPFILGMFAIMYFLMIRPERKRQLEHTNLVSALKRGDEVVLTSGIVAKIHAVEEKTLIVEIADKTRIKVLKQAVSGPSSRFLGDGKTPEKLEEKADDKKTDDKKSDEKKSA
jgi:preprotein translocase subunit YajC